MEYNFMQSHLKTSIAYLEAAGRSNNILLMTDSIEALFKTFEDSKTHYSIASNICGIFRTSRMKIKTLKSLILFVKIQEKYNLIIINKRVIIRNKISHQSGLSLFTNFDHEQTMKLRSICQLLIEELFQINLSHQNFLITWENTSQFKNLNLHCVVLLDKLICRQHTCSKGETVKSESWEATQFIEKIIGFKEDNSYKIPGLDGITMKDTKVSINNKKIRKLQRREKLHNVSFLSASFEDEIDQVRKNKELRCLNLPRINKITLDRNMSVGKKLQNQSR